MLGWKNRVMAKKTTSAGGWSKVIFSRHVFSGTTFEHWKVIASLGKVRKSDFSQKASDEIFKRMHFCTYSSYRWVWHITKYWEFFWLIRSLGLLVGKCPYGYLYYGLLSRGLSEQIFAQIFRVKTEQFSEIYPSLKA